MVDIQLLLFLLWSMAAAVSLENCINGTLSFLYCVGSMELLETVCVLVIWILCLVVCGVGIFKLACLTMLQFQLFGKYLQVSARLQQRSQY